MGDLGYQHLWSSFAGFRVKLFGTGKVPFSISGDFYRLQRVCLESVTTFRSLVNF